MTDRQNLKPGSFYWVRPAFDADFTPPGFEEREHSPLLFEASWAHWWQNEQPALFIGRAENGSEKWAYIGQDIERDNWWPTVWVGAEIVR